MQGHAEETRSNRLYNVEKKSAQYQETYRKLENELGIAAAIAALEGDNYHGIAVEVAALRELFAAKRKMEDLQSKQHKSFDYIATRIGKVRKTLRQHYFAVPDIEQRKILIMARRMPRRLVCEALQHELDVARHSLQTAKHTAHAKPWLIGTTASVIAVLLGGGLAGLYGALAGVVGGFFLGKWLVDNSHKRILRQTKSGQWDVDSLSNLLLACRRAPEWFSESEENSGERDLYEV